MSEKNTQSWLPKFELMVIGVFFISFAIWATSKCSATQAEYTEKIPVPEQATTTAEKPVQEKVITTVELPPEEKEEKKEKPKRKSSLTQERYTSLYVVMNGLNVRTGPSLDSAIVATLPLFEEVSFMNEKTEFKQRISLGKVEANEPWVKIRTRKNKVGWVYGAGVHYYKEKREGVE